MSKDKEKLGGEKRSMDEWDFKEMYREHIHREGAEELLSWLEHETDFFTAPASTRHHLAYPGGLVAHSCNVFVELSRVVAENSMETAAICGLLHDVCKANYYTMTQPEKGKMAPMGYAVEDKFPFGHGEKSVYLISRFMKLTDEEALAIRWHMGAFDDAVRGGSRGLNEAMRLYRLVYELHAADMRATHIVEAGS